MPTYDYECQNCRHKLETIQKITEAPLKKCPECKKNTLQRVVSGTSFHLKGQGWFKKS